MLKYSIIFLDADNASGLTALRLQSSLPFAAISKGDLISAPLIASEKSGLEAGCKYRVLEVLHDFHEQNPQDPDSIVHLIQVTVKKV